MLNGRAIEILAPAKNRDIGIAAVDCGADALYIAGPSFGAREAAGNPIEDVGALVNYARRYGVKVYMVINTVLYDNELEEAASLANRAYEIGCDALIVQDMGLINMDMPPIPIFASTQTDIRTVEQAKALEQLGFSRLILARELSLQQISEIGKSVDIEIESFVHGALCVSYSGQCYMSRRVTGRSANRGECAQMCRSEYNLLDSEGRVVVKNRALLSLKDLNLSQHIGKLIEAGVTSFKIEGRLKNISYLKNIVRYYRSVVDSYLDGADGSVGYRKTSFGKLFGGFSPNPDYTYSRGYTTLNIDGVRGAWCSGSSTKSVGESIGVVNSVLYDNSGNTGFTYIADSGACLGNGDGLVFIRLGDGGDSIVNGDSIVGGRISNGIVADGSVFGARASVVERLGREVRVFLNEKIGLRKGDEILRNYNLAFEKELESNMPARYIEVSLSVTYSMEEVVVKAKSEDGREEWISIRRKFDVAKDAEKVRDTIAKQLGKSTDIYMFKVLEIRGVADRTEGSVDEVPFIPLSELNGMRRELSVRLNMRYPEKGRIVRSKVKKGGIFENMAGFKFDYRANIANKRAKEFYDKLSGGKSKWGFEIKAPEEAELMRCKYCIKFELGYCTKYSRKKGASNAALPKEPLFLENGRRKFRLGFDCVKCEMIIFA